MGPRVHLLRSRSPVSAPGQEMATRVTGGKVCQPPSSRRLAKTEGVPLCVEELTKMVLEAGLVREGRTAIPLPVRCPPWRFLPRRTP